MRFASSCLVSALLAAGVAAPAAAADAPPVRLDVGLVAGADPSAVEKLLNGLAVEVRPVDGLDAITVDVPPGDRAAALAMLDADPAVRYAEVGGVVHADSDPYENYNLAMMRYNQIGPANTWSTGSPSITVAVVDTGVSVNADLPADRMTPGYDFVDGDDTPADDDDHGTLVANVIAAQPGNGVGTAGICGQCRIMPVRVLSHRSAVVAAEGSSADVAAGIAWAADHGAQIINLSLSTGTPSRLLEDAVRHAAARGALVIASAGHTSSTARQYPAAIEPVLAVGSSWGGTLPAYQTNRNTPTDRWIDVAAGPYAWAMAAHPGGRALNGTSASTAIVAGAAALGLAVRPAGPAADLRAAIIGTSVPPEIKVRSYDPPTLDAAALLHELGAVDGVAPQVLTSGLTDGQVVSPALPVTVAPDVADDHGVRGFDLVLNGKVVATHPYSWSPVLRLQAPAGHDGDLPVTVRAYDYGGNVTEKTTTVRVDGTAPVGSITSPVEGQHVRGAVDVVFTSGETGLATVLVNTDDKTYPVTHVAGSTRWTSRVVPTANGLITVQARDAAGNETLLSRHVVVDNAGPTAQAMSPAWNARVRGTVATNLSGVTDPSGVAFAQLWADGVYLGADRIAPYGGWVKTGTRSGTVTLTWRLTDKLGNVRTLTRPVIADNAGPAVAVTKAPANKAKVTGTVNVSVSASDAGGVARVELLVNGKVVARDYTSGYLLGVNTAKQAKTMKVQVRAYDRVGNVRYTSTRTWYRK
jgi:subtilase family protein/Big-like domain-containing protein